MEFRTRLSNGFYWKAVYKKLYQLANLLLIAFRQVLPVSLTSASPSLLLYELSPTLVRQSVSASLLPARRQSLDRVRCFGFHDELIPRMILSKGC